MVGCGLLYLSCNQIEGFFDQQWIWKETIDVFNFLHRGNHHGKLVFKTNALIWVWSGVPLSQLDSRILWSSISLEGISWYLCLTIVNIFYLFPCILSNVLGIHLVMTCFFLLWGLVFLINFTFRFAVLLVFWKL